jgi:hypothetical protein
MSASKKFTERMNQLTIKETLQKRKQIQQQKVMEVDEDDYLKEPIPPYLRITNEINKPCIKYHVTTFAKVYFREHSNINEVFKIYIEKNKIEPNDQIKEFERMIRHIMSNPRLKHFEYPLNMFRFDGVHEETIAKILLNNPMIKDEHDLKDTLQYFKKYDIQPCHVAMYADNEFHQNTNEYLEMKKIQVGHKRLPNFQKTAMEFALRKYFEEHDLIEDYHLNDISVEDMSKVSNFDNFTDKKMAEYGTESVDDFKSCFLEACKSRVDLLVNDFEFRVNPKYNLHCNNLSELMEKHVSMNVKRFYTRTNAYLLLKRQRYRIKGFPIKDLEIDQKKKFFLMYLRSKNKKQAPFEMLILVPDEVATENAATAEIDFPEIQQIYRNQPSVSAISQATNQATTQATNQRATQMQWKQRKMCEKAVEPTSEVATSTSTSPETVVTNEMTFNKFFGRKSFDEYLTDLDDYPKEHFEIAKMLANEKTFMAKLFDELLKVFGLQFCTIYVHNKIKLRIIVVNAIHFLLKDSMDLFHRILNECSEDVKTKVNDIFLSSATENCESVNKFN